MTATKKRDYFGYIKAKSPLPDSAWEKARSDIALIRHITKRLCRSCPDIVDDVIQVAQANLAKLAHTATPEKYDRYKGLVVQQSFSSVYYDSRHTSRREAKHGSPASFVGIDVDNIVWREEKPGYEFGDDKLTELFARANVSRKDQQFMLKYASCPLDKVRRDYKKSKQSCSNKMLRLKQRIRSVEVSLSRY